MPRKVIIDGKAAIVPDDATDDEINQLFPAPGPTGAPKNFVPTNTMGPSQENSVNESIP